jgi:L-2-hydroxyglutarate oxidase LhgO
MINLDLFYHHVTHHALDSEGNVLFGPNFIFIARETHEKATRERNREKTKGMADQNN